MSTAVLCKTVVKVASGDLSHLKFKATQICITFDNPQQIGASIRRWGAKKNGKLPGDVTCSLTTHLSYSSSTLKFLAPDLSRVPLLCSPCLKTDNYQLQRVCVENKSLFFTICAFFAPRGREAPSKTLRRALRPPLPCGQAEPTKASDLIIWNDNDNDNDTDDDDKNNDDDDNDKNDDNDNDNNKDDDIDIDIDSDSDNDNDNSDNHDDENMKT